MNFSRKRFTIRALRAGVTLFTTGNASRPLSIPTSGSFGLTLSTTGGTAAVNARRDAIMKLLSVDRENAFLDAASRVTDLPTRDAIGDRWARFLRRQDLTGYDPEKLLAMGDDLIRAAIDEAS